MEPNAFFVLEKPLNRGALVIDEGGDNLPVFGRLLAFDDNYIAVVYAYIYHAGALNLKHKQLAVCAKQASRQGKGVFVIFERELGRACGNGADKGDLYHIAKLDLLGAYKLYPSAFLLASLYVAQILQLFEIIGNAGSGFYVKLLLNLPDGRGILPFGYGLLYVGKYLGQFVHEFGILCHRICSIIDIYDN